MMNNFIWNCRYRQKLLPIMDFNDIFQFGWLWLLILLKKIWKQLTNYFCNCKFLILLTCLKAMLGFSLLMNVIKYHIVSPWYLILRICQLLARMDMLQSMYIDQLQTAGLFIWTFNICIISQRMFRNYNNIYYQEGQDCNISNGFACTEFQQTLEKYYISAEYTIIFILNLREHV